MGPSGWGHWPEAFLGKIGVYHEVFLPRAEKERDLHNRVADREGINFVCLQKHINTHTLHSSQAGWDKFLLERAWLLSCPSGEDLSPQALPLLPVTETVSRVGYLKGDVEGLEMTLQVI